MRTIKISDIDAEVRAFYKLDEISAILSTAKTKLQKEPNRIYAKKPVWTNIKEQRVFRWLYNNLDKIILMKPNEIKEFIDGIKLENWIAIQSNKKLVDKIIAILDYDGLRLHGREHISRISGLKTCAYCNAQLAVYKDEKNKATYQLDHFQPKAHYPIFSISFYNLIPSCGNCNGEKNDDLPEDDDFHLYEEEEYTPFRFKLDNRRLVEWCLNPKKNNIGTKFVHSKLEYAPIAEKHDKNYDIQGIYESQSDLAEELVVKAQIYTNEYRKDLSDLLGNTKSTLPLDQLILANYPLEEDIHKRPMAKFTQDIARELGLLKTEE